MSIINKFNKNIIIIIKSNTIVVIITFITIKHTNTYKKVIGKENRKINKLKIKTS